MITTLVTAYTIGICTWVAVWSHKINRSNIKPHLRREELERYIIFSLGWPIVVPPMIFYYLFVTLPAKLLIKD